MSKTNPIVLKSQSDIGMLSAENDDSYLFECFIKNNYYHQIEDVESPKMILSGRTGSGKSAVIRYLEENSEHCSVIDLQDMSMDYIANSDVVNFLIALDVDVDLVFQTLWKHVLCIELIRLIFNVKNENQSKSLYNRLLERLSNDGRKAKALEYLRKWEAKFWIDMDENVREITEELEKKVSAECGSEVEKFKGNAGYARTIKHEKKLQLQTRIKKIVNTEQLADLSRVLDLLKFEASEGQKKFYILFDRLDEKWADDSLKYVLISSLFEVLASFRKIKNLKIVIGVRSDLLETTLRNHRATGYQRDKFGDVLQEIRWSKGQLFDLVSTRIQKMFERKYTKQDIGFYDIFCPKVGQVDTFEYMLSRTLMRPREILDFVNRCIVAAEGKTQISVTNVRSVEVEYSLVRLESIENEWRQLYPFLRAVIDKLKGVRKNLSFSEFTKSERMDSIIEAIFDGQTDKSCAVRDAVSRYIETGKNEEKLIVAKRLVVALYRVGILGIKRTGNLSMQWADLEKSVIEFDDLNDDFRMQFHDTFDLSLGVR